jgi:uncharacterized protein (TIGR00255 family)
MAGERRGSIQSMTGYGRASRRTAAGTVTVELRSTNHRFLELETRLPNGMAALQGRLAALLREQLRRGRIEAAVTLHGVPGDRRRIAFDEALLGRYHRALVELKGRFGIKDAVALDHLLALPQAVTVVEERLPAERLWDAIRETARAAVADLVRARQREGAKLIADLRRQLRLIEQHVRSIKAQLPKALAHERRQLRRQLRALLGTKSPGTAALEQAVALVKDVDVHEELVRLESHVAYMRQTLAGRQLVGKRLDFMAQELMREANTTGAKVDDPLAARHVVELKGCIEKIREQVQNLE